MKVLSSFYLYWEQHFLSNGKTKVLILKKLSKNNKLVKINLNTVVDYSLVDTHFCEILGD